FLAWLLKRDVTPHIPVLDRKHQTNGKYDISHFQYDADRDSYTCLEGHEMPLRRIKEDARIKSYHAGKETCGACLSARPAPMPHSEPLHATWMKMPVKPSAI
ncbi:MAG: hypothetical protein AAFO75_11290, partial [Pseudomonadota bacterium]